MHNIRSLGNIEICGVAASVPSQKFDFSNYPYFTEYDKKEFAKLVGVESKRHSNGKLTSSDLCFASAQSLLMELNWEPEEVELLILVTQSPDYTVPASAVLLQHRLNLSNKAIVFDINLGCSGWVYGLLTVAALMKSVNIKKALLLTGETSIIANYQDKSSFPLMGDAGAATALTITDSDCQMHFDINVAGDGYQAIIAKQSGARHRAMNNELQSYNHDVTLDGGKVLDFCLRKVAPSIVKLLSETNTNPATIDYFVFHQANRIINENLRKKLGIPVKKFPYSISQFGNTSSASIPLTMVTQLNQQLRSQKLSLLCSGFGVGLSWGSVLLHTKHLACPDLIEI